MIAGGRFYSLLANLRAAPGQRWLSGLPAADSLQLACLAEVRGVLRLSGPDLIPFLQVRPAGTQASQPRG